MAKLYLSLKLKNDINKERPENSFEFYLKNIAVNGQKRGCSGFIRNNKNGKILYINTEKSCYGPLSDQNLFRTAKNLKDYTGGYNCFECDNFLAETIVRNLEA